VLEKALIESFFLEARSRGYWVALIRAGVL
jgi:hypothetical protein